MVGADKMFATNRRNKQNPKMLDHERSATASLLWKLTRCLQQITTNQTSKTLEHKEAESLWWLGRWAVSTRIEPGPVCGWGASLC